MIELSLMIEGQMGLTWPIWKTLAQEVEALGFDGLFRSDHYTNGGPPDQDSLETIVSLAYLADRTSRIHFGPLVAPVSFREPTMLARQAASIDDLSGGRMVLGLGAGWNEREHSLFGHALGDINERMKRFEEGLEVITRLLRSDEPSSYEGEYFNLREATLLPRPQRKGGPPILIGGNGPQRTLPLAAHYADEWNAIGLPLDTWRERSARLDSLLAEQERQPGDVKRSMMVQVIFGRTREELEARFALPPFNQPKLADKSLDEKIAYYRNINSLVGNGEEIAAQLKGLSEAGLQQVMTQWFHMDDSDGLRAYGEDVIPLIK